MAMSKGEEIEHAIFKAVSQYSFEEWLDDKGINFDEWEKFMKGGKSALQEEESQSLCIK